MIIFDIPNDHTIQKNTIKKLFNRFKNGLIVISLLAVEEKIFYTSNFPLLFNTNQ